MLNRVPVRCANSSAAMCWLVAGPAVARSTVPGAALAAATSDRASRCGKEGCATSSSGMIATLVMKAKSRSAS